VLSAKFKKTFLNYFWRIALTIALLYVVFRQINLVDLWQRLQSTNPLALVIFLLGEFLLTYLTSIRWAVLVVPSPSKKDIKAFFKATMLGLFYNLFMPSGMGGDLVKWTALTDLKISKSKLVFTMLLDRLMGMFGLIVLGFVGVLLMQFYGVANAPTPVLWLFVALFVGTVALFFFIYSPLQLKHLPLIRRIKPLLKIEDYLAENKNAFVQAFILGILIQLIWLIIVYVLAQAVGFTTGWWQFFCIQPVVNLVTALPISFAGFGITEVGFMYFYQQLGQESSAIVALTALLGVFRILMGFFGWLIGMIGEKKQIA